MSCCSRNLKKCNYKSVQRVFNNSSQEFLAIGTTLNLLGALATDTGVSIKTNINNFSFDYNGTYRISADVTLEPTTTGVATLQLYKNGVALPCAICTKTAMSDVIYTLHVETDLYLKEDDVISVMVSGVPGSVTWLGATCEKLA